MDKRGNAKKRRCCENNTGIALGISLGVAFGVALDNIALGISLGIVFGAAYDQGLFTVSREDKD